LAIVQKRPKTIKSDQNRRNSSTNSSKSAQKNLAQFNIFMLKPLWRYQEGRSDPKKARQNALFTVEKNVSHRKRALLTLTWNLKPEKLAAHVGGHEQPRNPGLIIQSPGGLRATVSRRPLGFQAEAAIRGDADQRT
jgi:hypothetical protein